jgi:hypothetical protein
MTVKDDLGRRLYLKAQIRQKLVDRTRLEGAGPMDSCTAARHLRQQQKLQINKPGWERKAELFLNLFSSVTGDHVINISTVSITDPVYINTDPSFFKINPDLANNPTLQYT